jgi:hypothetical protein
VVESEDFADTAQLMLFIRDTYHALYVFSISYEILCYPIALHIKRQNVLIRQESDNGTCKFSSGLHSNTRPRATFCIRSQTKIERCPQLLGYQTAEKWCSVTLDTLSFENVNINFYDRKRETYTSHECRSHCGIIFQRKNSK